MTQTLEALEIDERCQVLVLTGAGDAFSAGMDLKEFFRESDVKPAEEWGQIARQATIWQLDRLKWFPKITIAMVNGWCFGGAFNPVVSLRHLDCRGRCHVRLERDQLGHHPGRQRAALRRLAHARDGRAVLFPVGRHLHRQGRGAHGAGELLVSEGRAKAKTRELALKLGGKNRAAARAIKHAYRKMQEMSWQGSEDYLMAKLDQLRLMDPDQGRGKAMNQFLDEKSYRPGLGDYKRK